MSPTPSIAKASILSPSTSISSPPPPPRKTHHCASNSPNYFPPSHPTRTLYLVARSTSVLLGLLQITLAAIAYTLFSRRWLDPTLSPAITTFIYSAIEIFSVLYWHARAHYYTRAFYDGGISVGFAVAAGFMVKLAVGSMKEGEGGEGAGVLGGVILMGMISQIFVHAAVSVGGVRDVMRVRREKRERERDVET